jgi:uncharacterized protein DUF4019
MRKAGIALAISLLLVHPAASDTHPTFQSLWEAVAHAPDCAKRDDVDLVIVACDKSQAVWYFTKPGHPAHPGVVERQATRDAKGAVGVSENGWSFAPDAAQPAFKTFIAQIRALDRQMMTSLYQRNAAGASANIPISGNAKPSARDKEAVLALTAYLFTLEDGGHYEDAYALFDPGLTALLPLSQYEATANEARIRVGPVKSRAILRIDWEKDAPDAPPGTYAALDYAAIAERGQLCGYVAWRKQPDGFFILVHEETAAVPNAQTCAPPSP